MPLVGIAMPFVPATPPPPVKKVICQARERGTNSNFWVPDNFRWGGGVFHVKRWGPKSSVCPSKPRENKLIGGISQDFGWDMPGVPGNPEKKSLYSIFGP